MNEHIERLEAEWRRRARHYSPNGCLAEQAAWDAMVQARRDVSLCIEPGCRNHVLAFRCAEHAGRGKP